MADATRTVRRLGRAAGVAGNRLVRRRSAPTVEDSRMTLVEHLQELRKRLLIAFLVLGPALDVLLGFAGHGVVSLLEVNQYISFVMSMLVIFGVSFEFPLVLILLNLAGVVSSTRLRSWRRVAIFLMFAFAGFA